jgi:hypothetical protein
MIIQTATVYVVTFVLAALAITISMRLLDGTINTRGLLFGRRRDGTRYFSPERVQLLAATFWAAAQYLGEVLQHPHAGSLPEVPVATLGLLGGSHGVYLGGKAFALLFSSVSREG